MFATFWVEHSCCYASQHLLGIKTLLWSGPVEGKGQSCTINNTITTYYIQAMLLVIVICVTASGSLQKSCSVMFSFTWTLFARVQTRPGSHLKGQHMFVGIFLWLLITWWREAERNVIENDSIWRTHLDLPTCIHTDPNWVKYEWKES